MSILSLDEFDDILKPKTPTEFAATLGMYTARKGHFSEPDIENLKARDDWRTKTEEFRGREFCAECSQLIPSKYCRECGLPLPALQPAILDLIPVKTELRAQLENVIESFIAARPKVAPKLVLGFMHFVNQSSQEMLQTEDVEMIFHEAVAKALGKAG